MLHKAEEWKVIGHAPKIKVMKEHGRHLRLDADAEKKLIAEPWLAIGAYERVTFSGTSSS
jgi:hypothetical protein